MLTHIHIKDLAVVEALELELRAGMTALTGETGAGKSILVDAVGLALGDRGDTDMVRPGANQAEVSVAFDLSQRPDALAFLAEQSLEPDADNECLVRRTLSAEGRSRGYVNGRPVPMQTLKGLGECLVDIHGQHAHQSLTRRDVQRQLLDSHAGNHDALARVADAYQQWQAAQAEYDRLRQAAEDRDARLDLLRYQVRELEALDLQPDEPAELEREHRQLANAGTLGESCQRVLGWLRDDEDHAGETVLAQALAELRRLSELDTQLQGPLEAVDAALIQLREASGELQAYLDRVDLDPQRLQWLEDRLAAVHDLARKHRVEAGQLPAVREQLQHELTDLEQADIRIRELAERAQTLKTRYDEEARALSERRRAAAGDLAAQVTGLMQRLGMPDGQVEVAVEPLPAPQHGPAGIDQVELRVTTNPGYAPRPLAKVASGGELSRIGLGFQVTVAAEGLPTLIFDEVDAGIGGGVAEIVGGQLRELSHHHQVLCVTHLPQVAVQAHQHLRIHKATHRGQTRIDVQPLDGDARVEEIARMLGGVEITAQTRAHAREMLDRAQAAPPSASNRAARKRSAAADQRS